MHEEFFMIMIFIVPLKNYTFSSHLTIILYLVFSEVAVNTFSFVWHRLRREYTNYKNGLFSKLEKLLSALGFIVLHSLVEIRVTTCHVFYFCVFLKRWLMKRTFALILGHKTVTSWPTSTQVLSVHFHELPQKSILKRFSCF